MKGTLKAFLLISAFYMAGCSQQQPPVEGQNSDHLILSTVWYQKSAEMRACYYQAYDYAKLKLSANLAEYKGSKPTAVVMDIDETILDNSPFEAGLIANKQLYSKQNWKEWSDQARAKALPGAVDFINFARSKGVQVVLISNRKSNEKESTLKNLSSVGIQIEDTTWFLLRQPDMPACKQGRRDMVNKQFDVLLYIGDNMADYSMIYDERSRDLAIPAIDSMRTELAHKFIVLPNPMYGDWEGAIYGNDYNIPVTTKRQMLIESLQK